MVKGGYGGKTALDVLLETSVLLNNMLLILIMTVMLSIIITAIAIRSFTKSTTQGTPLFQLELGERYTVEACVESKPSDDIQKSSWLLLLKDHNEITKLYKIAKSQFPEASVGDKVVLMTDGIENLK